MNSFVRWQQKLSFGFDRILPQQFSLSGKRDFKTEIVPSYLGHDLVVHDVGGGKNPVIRRETKIQYQLYVVGIDIDLDELQQAPSGSYDRIMQVDITDYRGNGEADLVVCCTVLEHVRDAGQAVAGLATMVKPGGRLLLFVPSRNALFARLNLALPERIKKWIMFTIFPEKERLQGFPAYYDKCTPSQMSRLLQRCGFELELQRIYYKSNYFSFLAPLHVVWRTYQLIMRQAFGDEAAETFALVAKKIPAGEDATESRPDVENAVGLSTPAQAGAVRSVGCEGSEDQSTHSPCSGPILCGASLGA